nr:MAG TPA: hypothetical protein [Caudoviricetes sp.]
MTNHPQNQRILPNLYLSTHFVREAAASPQKSGVAGDYSYANSSSRTLVPYLYKWVYPPVKHVQHNGENEAP